MKKLYKENKFIKNISTMDINMDANMNENIDDEEFISKLVIGQTVIHKALSMDCMQIIFYHTLMLSGNYEESVIRTWNSNNEDRKTLQLVCTTWSSILKKSCKTLGLSLNNIIANTFRISNYSNLHSLEFLNNQTNDSDYEDDENDSDSSDTDNEKDKDEYYNEDKGTKNNGNKVYVTYNDQGEEVHVESNVIKRVNDKDDEERIENKNSDRITNQLSTILLLSLPNLLKIDLSMTNLKQRHIKQLIPSLSTNTNIKKLVLDGCPIGDQGVIFIAKVLTSNKSLKILDLSSCNSINGLEYLGRSLIKENETLEKLIWSYNVSSYSSVMFLSNGLRANNVIKSVILKSCNIEGWGAFSIADTLAINKSLIELDLSSNQFNEAGAIAVADKLNLHPSLTAFDLSSNLVSEEGLDKLIGCFENNKTITNLNLSKNPIEVSSVEAIANSSPLISSLYISISKNQALTSLNLSECNLQNSHFQSIADALEVNKTLKKLDISRNNISNIKPLISIISNNKTLKSINLSKHKFSSNDIYIVINYIVRKNNISYKIEDKIITVDMIVHKLDFLNLSLPQFPVTTETNQLLKQYRINDDKTKIKVY